MKKQSPNIYEVDFVEPDGKKTSLDCTGIPQIVSESKMFPPGTKISVSCPRLKIGFQFELDKDKSIF